MKSPALIATVDSTFMDEGHPQNQDVAFCFDFELPGQQPIFTQYFAKYDNDKIIATIKSIFSRLNARILALDEAKEAGCTFSGALQVPTADGKHIRVFRINLGDSFTWLSRQQADGQLALTDRSADHSFDNPIEQARIFSIPANSSAAEKSSILFNHKLKGTLSALRAFGDAKWIPDGLSAIPDVELIATIPIDEAKKFGLLSCSDGVNKAVAAIPRLQKEYATLSAEEKATRDAQIQNAKEAEQTYLQQELKNISTASLQTLCKTSHEKSQQACGGYADDTTALFTFILQGLRLHAVLDGHGKYGHIIAQFVRDHIKSCFTEIVEQAYHQQYSRKDQVLWYPWIMESKAGKVPTSGMEFFEKKFAIVSVTKEQKAKAAAKIVCTPYGFAGVSLGRVSSDRQIAKITDAATRLIANASGLLTFIAHFTESQQVDTQLERSMGRQLVQDYLLTALDNIYRSQLPANAPSTPLGDIAYTIPFHYKDRRFLFVINCGRQTIMHVSQKIIAGTTEPQYIHAILATTSGDEATTTQVYTLSTASKEMIIIISTDLGQTKNKTMLPTLFEGDDAKVQDGLGPEQGQFLLTRTQLLTPEELQTAQQLGVATKFFPPKKVSEMKARTVFLDSASPPSLTQMLDDLQDLFSLSSDEVKLLVDRPATDSKKEGEKQGKKGDDKQQRNYSHWLTVYAREGNPIQFCQSNLTIANLTLYHFIQQPTIINFLECMNLYEQVFRVIAENYAQLPTVVSGRSLKNNDSAYALLAGLQTLGANIMMVYGQLSVEVSADLKKNYADLSEKFAMLYQTVSQLIQCVPSLQAGVEKSNHSFAKLPKPKPAAPGQKKGSASDCCVM